MAWKKINVSILWAEHYGMWKSDEDFYQNFGILIAWHVRNFIKFRGFLVDLSETIHIQVLQWALSEPGKN